MTLIALNGVELRAVKAALSKPTNRTAGFGDGSGYWVAVGTIAADVGHHNQFGAVLGLLNELVEQGRARRHPGGGLFFQPARSTAE